MTTNYQGYKNWETWNIVLWTNNEELLHNASRVCNTAKQFKQFVYDRFNASGSYGGDITDEASLNRVDWKEAFKAI